MIKLLKGEDETIERASELLDTNYTAEINEDGYVDENMIMELLEELVDCLEITKNEFEEFKKDHYERYQLKSEYRNEYY